MALAAARDALREQVAGTPLGAALEDLLAWDLRTGGGHVADAFWSAWEAVEGSDSYEAAVTRAVRFGHDTDTTAAIAGGLAGIRWGIAGIPAAWLAGMRGHDLAGPLVDRLLALGGWRTSTTSPLRVDWVPLGDVPGLAAASGAVGMTLLPGKKRLGYSGPHWRDPAADARRLRDVHRCGTFLLLVEDVDLAMSRAWATVPALEAAGIRVLRHPVPDMGVPADPRGLPDQPRRRAGGHSPRRAGRRRLPRRPRPDRDGGGLPARGRRAPARRGDRARPRRPPRDGGAAVPGGVRAGVGRPRGQGLMAGRVVVVGSVNVDLVVATARLPGPGETVTGGDVARHHGGKGGNQAVAAARLGASVAFVGAVGEDDFGLAARSALAAEGIDVTHLATASRPTGVALIVVDARAENLIAVAPGANASPTAASVAAALDALAVGPGDVVLASCEIPAGAVRSALATARAAGAVAVLNPAPADGLDAATIALADILTPNEAELALLALLAPLSGERRPEARKRP